MGSIGAPEIIILLIVAFFAYATFYGMYRAFTNGDSAWGFGIILSWLVGLGWLVGTIYLSTAGRRSTAA